MAKKLRLCYEAIKPFILAVIVVVLLQNFVILNAAIPSESMQPTIDVGSRVLFSRLSYLFEKPERGDVVVFYSPDNEEIYFVKRIAALPGETIEINQGQVYINQIRNETFSNDAPSGSEGDGVYTVPQNSYFMLGDNRNHSLDSRFWAQPYVNEAKILGKAIVTYWPKLGIIK